MGAFIDRPRTTRARRILFTVHLWLGVAVGLHLFVVCLSGALLVFRIDMQRALHSDLLLPRTLLPTLGPAPILRELERHYPDARIAGVDAPTTARPVYLAYVTSQTGFHAVLVDPGTARILGELPEKTPIRILQNLHFNLLLGERGKIINGVAALCLLALCLTGLAIWWQGRQRWRRGMKVRTRSGAVQFNFDLHSATGFWTFFMLLMWALTALHFTFPRQFRAVVETLSSITPYVMVKSDVSQTARVMTPPNLDSILERAQQEMPGQFVGRVVLPAREDDAFQILFARTQPTPTGPGALTPVYLDRYTGAVIQPPARSRSIGDVIMKWAAPLHVGNFAGNAVRIAWLVFGLAPPLLFITGMLSWWRRVVRPAMLRRSSSQQGESANVGASTQ